MMSIVDIYKSLYSKRNGLELQSSVLQREEMSKTICNVICSCYYLFTCEIDSLYRSERGYNGLSSRDIEKELWWRYRGKPLQDFSRDRSYKLSFTPLMLDADTIWYEKLNLLELVIKRTRMIAKNKRNRNLQIIVDKFVQQLNTEFERLDYGYRIVNDNIVDVTSEEELNCLNDALCNIKDNVREHLNRAIEHYSQKPESDVRNSIKESISAVEAVCRELTGEETLGKALKKLEDKGIILQSQLKAGMEKLYVYTNQPDTGIRHALMDTDGTYVPTKDEAYFMLISCSAFINYLRMKIAK